jgi:hypothetical protein
VSLIDVLSLDGNFWVPSSMYSLVTKAQTTPNLQVNTVQWHREDEQPRNSPSPCKQHRHSVSEVSLATDTNKARLHVVWRTCLANQLDLERQMSHLSVEIKLETISWNLHNP